MGLGIGIGIGWEDGCVSIASRPRRYWAFLGLRDRDSPWWAYSPVHYSIWPASGRKYNEDSIWMSHGHRDCHLCGDAGADAYVYGVPLCLERRYVRTRVIFGCCTGDIGDDAASCQKLAARRAPNKVLPLYQSTLLLYSGERKKGLLDQGPLTSF